MAFLYSHPVPFSYKANVECENILFSFMGYFIFNFWNISYLSKLLFDDVAENKQIAKEKKPSRINFIVGH